MIDLRKAILAIYARHEPKRHACKVRHIARLMWRGMEARQLELIAKSRGQDVADKLKLKAMDLVKEHRK